MGRETNRSALAEKMRAAGLRPARTLTLAITGRCNLRCLHCLVDAGPTAGARQVPAATVRRLVREFVSLGGEELVLTGGEPLLHPDWLGILTTCRRHRSLRSVGVQTNGALLGDAHIGALRALAFEGLWIQVSLDGASPATHDAVRGSGSFERALDGIRRLAAGGLGRQVSIAFTEMRHNIDDLPALLGLVESLGVRRLVSGTLVAQGRAGDGQLAPPTPDQYRALLARWHADARFRELYRAYGNVAAIEWWRGRLAAGTECCTFVERPYVTAEGTLHPCALCRADDFAVRDVFEKPLARVMLEGVPTWSQLLAVKLRRHGGLSPCQQCPGKAHCGGGCMGRAHAATGELMTVEDRCELRKAVYQWREGEVPRARIDAGAAPPPFTT